MREKTKLTPVLTSAPNELPAYQQGEQKGLFLNLCLDVEIDGVIYHLTSEFAEKTEMGEVLDTIELERSQRKTA